MVEFEKFAAGKKILGRKMPFDKLPGMLIPDSKGFVINPMGFNLPLDKEQLKRIAALPVAK